MIQSLPKTLKSLKQGEFFKRRPTSHTVYTRGQYDRSLKRFCCPDEGDISREICLKGDSLVYIDFEY